MSTLDKNKNLCYCKSMEELTMLGLIGILGTGVSLYMLKDRELLTSNERSTWVAILLPSLMALTGFILQIVVGV